VPVPWREVGGRLIEVAVRVSPRARLIRVVAHADGTVEVVVPKRTPRHAVDHMLETHGDWLVRQVERSHARRLGIQRPDVVWLHGQPLPLPRAASIDTWYRARAREAVQDVTSREAARLELRYGQLSIRDQRTRWGSCSSRGNLSFNWRLVMAPLEVLEYVVVHELCHLREHNHSQAFWKLVADARPTWKREKRWLDEHGPELLVYRPPEPALAAADAA